MYGVDCNMNSTVTPAQQRRRRRPALACERCRQRKIKCDRNIPCTQCVRTKCEPCTYVPDDHPARSRHVEWEHSHSVIANAATIFATGTGTGTGTDTPSPSMNGFDRLADPFSAHASDLSSSTRPPAGNRTSSTEGQCRASSKASTASPVFPHSPSSVQALGNRVQELERKLSQTVNTLLVEPVTGSLCSDDPGLPVRGIYSKTRLFGEGHWRSSVVQVRLFTTSLRHPSALTFKLLLRIVPQNCDMLNH
jgi:Fungal Zn(2)-Cys(6) binuclear cluster domain